jgi:hypothetical protein
MPPSRAREMQGCRIFLGTTYQNGKILQMATNYNKRALKYEDQMATN